MIRNTATLTLESLNLASPKVDAEKRKELEAVRAMLEGKDGVSK